MWQYRYESYAFAVLAHFGVQECTPAIAHATPACRYGSIAPQPGLADSEKTTHAMPYSKIDKDLCPWPNVWKHFGGDVSKRSKESFNNYINAVVPYVSDGFCVQNEKWRKGRKSKNHRAFCDGPSGDAEQQKRFFSSLWTFVESEFFGVGWIVTAEHPGSTVVCGKRQFTHLEEWIADVLGISRA